MGQAAQSGQDNRQVEIYAPRRPAEITQALQKCPEIYLKDH
jgi:hypothetical protein